MTKRLVLVFTLLMLWGGTASVQGQVSFKQSPNKIDVEIAGKPFTTLYYDAKWPKPFLHPLRASSGTIVTRGFPLEKIEGESNDHFWHRGLWFAHGDINGIDFWREASGDPAKDAKLPLPVGRIVSKAQPKTTNGKNEGTITTDFNLVAPDSKVVGTLREQYTFRRVGQNNIIDLQATILADQGTSLKMGDTEEGLLGFRFADEFRQDRGATLSNSEGLKGTENIWGKRARWVDYSTTIKGEKTGVVIFDHPQNPKHPTFWHARGYGLNAANPFGEHDFYNDKSRDGSLTIPAGKDLSFRYRVVIHPGTVESLGADQLFTAFKGN
ncbi:MAG: PmoA family protein [Pyrinomonadaceae bacterium]|nr:PmoA family protein [Pyrinomonadaceae bacterium]